MSRVTIIAIAFSLIFAVAMLDLASADIWKKHINSNHADQVLGNENEIWVRSEFGGLTRWYLETSEPQRFYDAVGFPSNVIFDMVYDDENRLLVIDDSWNIYRYENGLFNWITRSPNYSEEIAFADSSILIIGKNKSVNKFNGEEWETIQKLSEYKITYIFGDPRGGFWASTTALTSALIYFKDSQMDIYSLSEITGISEADTFRSNIIKNINVDDEGIVWATIHGGVAWLDEGNWNQYFWDKENLPTRRGSVVRDNEGIVWVTGGIDGLFRYDGENWEDVAIYNDVDVLWSEKGASDGIWVGTEKCLEFFDGVERILYEIPNLLPISNDLRAFDVNSDGELWCGNHSGDIAVLNRNTWTAFHSRYVSEVPKEELDLRSLLASESAGVWAGFFWDLVRFDGNLWISYNEVLESKIGRIYAVIEEGPDGKIWVSGQHGLATWVDDIWTFHEKLADQRSIIAFDIAFDVEDNTWITNGGGIFMWNNVEWTHVLSPYDMMKDFSTPDVITAMRDGSLWVSGWNAIAIIRDMKVEQYFTAEDGLPHNEFGVINVTAIEQAPDDTIWILSKHGLAHYDGITFKKYASSSLGFSIGLQDLVIEPSGRIFVVGSGITEFIPTSLTLKMNLFAGGLVYKTGDNLSLSFMINNYGPEETGDLYFVMVTPEGKIYSGLEWTELIHPVASNITISEKFFMPMIEVVNVSLPSESPPISKPGKYYFGLGFADPGTTYFRSKTIISIDVIK